LALPCLPRCAPGADEVIELSRSAGSAYCSCGAHAQIIDESSVHDVTVLLGWRSERRTCTVGAARAILNGVSKDFYPACSEPEVRHYQELWAQRVREVVGDPGRL
jgi:hypothetical protein